MGANTSTGGYPMVSSTISGNSSTGLLLPHSGVITAGPTGSGGGPGGGGLSGGGTSLSYGVSMSSAVGGAGGPQFREQRRKRVTGFATLKRKFIRRRRSSKACDHARVLREFVSDWTPLELAALCEEYEALSALRDLSMQAELARPPATTYKQDLAALYEMHSCTDCDLVFRGNIFPVHRSILSSRCSYFRDLLVGCPGFGARICLELPASPIDVPMFASLLRYLYTGDLCTPDTTIDINLLRQLGDDFGTPNPLENDLRYLLETGDYADAALVFTAEGNDYHRPDSGSSEYGFRPKLELPCHKAILSARSPFFRNLIARRTRNVDEYTERSMHVPTRIVLDESVIPKRYARVLLHAIYLDTVDLTLILRGTGTGNAAGSLGEVHALTNTGRTRPTPLEEAMELYQIGRFLELDILAQGCEDLILEWLSLDTLSTVLKWGSQAHGSAWVFRQACQYLREEFSAVAGSQVLHQLDKQQLINVLQSNFLQASELEVLQAVLKWGEQELVRRMEDREPNILSHTAHSVARKGVKKRDLSDVELREILSELLPLVRMDHVLPPNSEILGQAIRRGLVSTPPSHMIGDERENLRVNAWIRGGKNQGLFVRPRLFMPYFEEVKALLQDRLASTHQPNELLRMRRVRHMPDIPDTLYMVSRMNAVGNSGVGESAHCSRQVDALDMLSVAASIPPPDTQTLATMLKREHKLRQTPMCQRALMLPLSAKHEIDRQIRLRVVREFNLPDGVSDLLETSILGTQTTLPDQCESATKGHSSNDCILEDDNSSPPPSPAASSSVPGTHVNIQSNVYLTTSMANSSSTSSTCAGNVVNQPCYNRNLTFPRPQHNVSSLLGFSDRSSGSGGAGSLHPASYARLSASVHNHQHQHQLHYPHHHQHPHNQRSDLPALITEGEYRYPHRGSTLRMDMGVGDIGVNLALDGGGGVGHLSDMMPDVAMATASLGQLHLANNNNNNNNNNHNNNQNHINISNNNSSVDLGGINHVNNHSGDIMPDSLQLDLGDGSSHNVMRGSGGNIAAAMSLRGLQHQIPHNNYHNYMHRSNSPFDILRQGQHSPAPHAAASSSAAGPSTAGTYNTGPPRFL